MRHLYTTAYAVGISALLAGGVAAQERTPINVYTAMAIHLLEPFEKEIETAVPEVDIVWVRDATGVISARLIAEAANPQADLVLGIALPNVLVFDEKGLLESYKPKDVDTLRPKFRDSRAEPTWFGIDAYVAVVCYNTIEGENAKIVQPTSWQGLLAPELKGKVVMPHPVSSGTGYAVIGGWIKLMGEDKAWEYMDKLHENISSYLHSGQSPCVQAARGEMIAGVSLDMRGIYERAQGAPIEVIVPEEGTGWEMEAVAIVKGTKNLEVAKKVADWATTKQANEHFSKNYAVVAHPEVKNFPEGYPTENIETKLADIDFTWLAQNRDRILAEWSRRYESKAAPK